MAELLDEEVHSHDAVDIARVVTEEAATESRKSAHEISSCCYRSFDSVDIGGKNGTDAGTRHIEYRSRTVIVELDTGPERCWSRQHSTGFEVLMLRQWCKFCWARSLLHVARSKMSVQKLCPAGAMLVASTRVAMNKAGVMEGSSTPFLPFSFGYHTLLLTAVRGPCLTSVSVSWRYKRKGNFAILCASADL